MSIIKTLNIFTQVYSEPIKCKYDSEHMTAESCLNGYLLSCLEGKEESDLAFYERKEISALNTSSMIKVTENIFTDSIIDYATE